MRILNLSSHNYGATQFDESVYIIGPGQSARVDSSELVYPRLWPVEYTEPKYIVDAWNNGKEFKDYQGYRFTKEDFSEAELCDPMGQFMFIVE